MGLLTVWFVISILACCWRIYQKRCRDRKARSESGGKERDALLQDENGILGYGTVQGEKDPLEETSRPIWGYEPHHLSFTTWALFVSLPP